MRVHESCLVSTKDTGKNKNGRSQKDIHVTSFFVWSIWYKIVIWKGTVPRHGFFLHKTAANLPFTQRRRRHRRIACVVDTDNETVATSARQLWHYWQRWCYINLEKDPSPESTMPVSAQCREYLNDFKGKLEITKIRGDPQFMQNNRE